MIVVRGGPGEGDRRTPFSSPDAAGNWVGWEIEIIEAVCAAAELECELAPTAWDGIIPALVSGRIDAIMGSMSITEDRLQTIDFSASRDTLYVLGDLVNRGPDSLAVLRRLSALGNAAQCLLGNHDLHLLGVWQGVRTVSKGDTLAQLLAAHLRERPTHDWLVALDAAGIRNRVLVVSACYSGGWIEPMATDSTLVMTAVS